MGFRKIGTVNGDTNAPATFKKVGTADGSPTGQPGISLESAQSEGLISKLLKPLQVQAGASRGAIRALGAGQDPYSAAVQGFQHPEKVETFQDEALRGTNDMVTRMSGGNEPGTAVRFAAGIPASIFGLAVDAATDPLTYETAGLGYGVKKLAQVSPEVVTGLKALRQVGRTNVIPAGPEIAQNVAKSLGRAATWPKRQAESVLMNLAGSDTKTLKNIKNLGGHEVLNTGKEAPEYIGASLRPGVEETVRKNALDLNPETLRHLKDSGLDDAAIKELSTMQTQAEKFGGEPTNTADIVAQVKDKLGKAVNYSKRQYADVMKKIPLKKRLKPNEFEKNVTSSLEGMFKPNGQGFRDDIAESTLHSRKPFMQLYNEMYKKGYDKSMDKTQYVLMHDHLIKLQQSPDGYISRTATELKGALEKDAQAFGFGDIAGVKEGWKQGKTFEPFLAKTNFSERKLNGMLTGEEEGQLRQLEEYLGHKFVDQVKRINTRKEYDALLKRTVNSPAFSQRMESLLKTAQNPANVAKRAELKALLGEKAYNGIIKNLEASRIAEELTTKGMEKTSARVYAGGGAIRESVSPVNPKFAARKIIKAIYGKSKPKDEIESVPGLGQRIADTLKKKMANQPFGNEKGFILIGNEDRFSFSRAYPTRIKGPTGQMIEKFTYDPALGHVIPVEEGDAHAQAIWSYFGQQKRNIRNYDEMTRGIHLKNGVAYFRPSAPTAVLELAQQGDERAWNQILRTQREIADQLFAAEPGKKVILAGGGSKTLHGNKIAFFEDADHAPKDILKLAGKGTVYTIPDLTKTEKNALQGFEKLFKAGGATVDVVDGSMPKKGFIYSTKFERSKPVSEFSFQDLKDYVAEHADELKKDGKYLGLWKDEEHGILYTDVSHVTNDVTEAVTVAQAHNQISVWDEGGKRLLTVGKRDGEKYTAFKPSEIKGLSDVEKTAFGQAGGQKIPGGGLREAQGNSARAGGQGSEGGRIASGLRQEVPAPQSKKNPLKKKSSKKPEKAAILAALGLSLSQNSERKQAA